MELAVIGALIGIALGLRYKVLILVPAVTLAAIFTILVGVGGADGFWSITLMTVAVVTALQLGYLVGIVIHAVIEDFFPSRNGNGDSQLFSRTPFRCHSHFTSAVGNVLHDG
jgi:hypothetical protein